MSAEWITDKDGNVVRDIDDEWQPKIMTVDVVIGFGGFDYKLHYEGDADGKVVNLLVDELMDSVMKIIPKKK